MNAIKLMDFKKNLNDFIIIDVRSRGYFLIDHIKDSINIENQQRIEFIAQENADKKIILYCHHGHTARILADSIANNGIKNVFFLDANFSDVVKSGIEIIYYEQPK